MPKQTDYCNWSEKDLDAAIMYQVQYGSDLQKLGHLLAARNYKERKAMGKGSGLIPGPFYLCIWWGGGGWIWECHGIIYIGWMVELIF